LNGRLDEHRRAHPGPNRRFGLHAGPPRQPASPVRLKIGAERMARLVHLHPFPTVVKGVKGGARILAIPKLVKPDQGPCIRSSACQGSSPEAPGMQTVGDVPAARPVRLAGCRLPAKDHPDKGDERHMPDIYRISRAIGRHEEWKTLIIDILQGNLEDSIRM